MHFHDDALMLSLSLEKGSGQQSYHAVLDITGTALDPDKRQRMGSEFVYVGVSFKLARLLANGTLTVDAKPGRREALLAEVHAFRTQGSMSPNEASSFRGRLGFLGSQLMGRVIRGCERPLIERQYRGSAGVLTPKLHQTLDFLELVLRKLPARVVRGAGAPASMALLWTDAMYEPPAPAGMGFVLSSPRLRRPVAGAAVIPHEVLAQFLPRKQQIGQAEGFAGILPLFNCADALKGLDLLHFVDNTSALAGFVNGTAAVEDSCAIFAVYHVMLARFGTRHWAEHVESKGNCSDGPSRSMALDDPLLEALCCDRIQARVPDLFDLYAAPFEQLIAAFE